MAEEEYKGIGKQDYNCAYAYWDSDDFNDDGSVHISGPYCGCEKEKARYGAYGAAACGGVKDCKYWRLRGRHDHAVLEASEEEYEEGRQRWEDGKRVEEEEQRAENAEEDSVKDAREMDEIDQIIDNFHKWLEPLVAGLSKADRLNVILLLRQELSDLRDAVSFDDDDDE